MEEELKVTGNEVVEEVTGGNTTGADDGFVEYNTGVTVASKTTGKFTGEYVSPAEFGKRFFQEQKVALVTITKTLASTGDLFTSTRGDWFGGSKLSTVNMLIGESK